MRVGGDSSARESSSTPNGHSHHNITITRSVCKYMYRQLLGENKSGGIEEVDVK